MHVYLDNSEPISLEKEFEFFSRLHKVNILISYYESKYYNEDSRGITKPDYTEMETPAYRAADTVNNLLKNPKLFESTYLTIWDRVADLLP